MSLENISSARCFDGQQMQYKHHSNTLNCGMQFSIFLPEESSSRNVPLLIWLSGLTCTDENFVTKAGAQQFAAKHGIAILAPDTSPRGEGVADDPEAAWDFGLGAGFYLNATEEPYNQHYQMYDYVVNELYNLALKEFPIIKDKVAISGHSMGGHGALTIGLKNPDKFRAISAFSPIIAPSQVPWGIKAFTNYLGDNQNSWQQYDALELLKQTNSMQPILVEQGTADSFIDEQLRPQLLADYMGNNDHNIQLNLRDEYDHSYYFISSFMESHIAFHAKHLND